MPPPHYDFLIKVSGLCLLQVIYTQQLHSSSSLATQVLFLRFTECTALFDHPLPSGVGKSCLLLRFCDDAWTPSFITTIGIDFKIRTIELDGKRIKLQIVRSLISMMYHNLILRSGTRLDRNDSARLRPPTTAVQWAYSSCTTSRTSVPSTVSVFPSIIDPRSDVYAIDIRTWHANIEQHASEGVNKILIGNKSDWTDKRAVTEEAGRELANELGIKFMETSAKVNEGVEEAFFTLARSVRSYSWQTHVLTEAFHRDIKTRLIDSQAETAGAGGPGASTAGSDSVKVNQPATQTAGGCC